MAKPLADGQDLQGGNGPLAAQILCAGHVPLSVGSGPARRAPAGLHRLGHLLALQAAQGLQRPAPDGIRRLRPAGRAVRHPDGPAPGRRRPSRTSPATASSWTRSVSRSTGTARCARATPATTSGRSGRSSKCSPIGTTVRSSRRAPSRSSSRRSRRAAPRASMRPARPKCASRPPNGRPRANPKRSRFSRTTGWRSAPTRWSTGVRSWGPCWPTTRCTTDFRSAAAIRSSRSA